MGAQSFTLEIELEKWAVGKGEAAHALIRAFEESSEQRFPDESLFKPKQLAMATIEMDEKSVKLIAHARMASYESIARKLIEMDGGIKLHLSKRGSLGLRAFALFWGALGRVDWEGTMGKACERMAKTLAKASFASLKADAEENIRSMESHLGIR